MTEIDSVSVAVRVRPLVRAERERGCQVAVERQSGGVPQIIVNRSEPYTFNYVFDENDDQRTIYESCVSNMLKKLLTGFNVTILAYGQTGSGKTFTMGTAFSGIIDDHVGIIPRAIYEIFEEIAAQHETTDFVVKCSFMELYNEQLFDLLSPNDRENSIVDLREDKSGIVIPGLTEKVVNSPQEVTKQLMCGSSERAVASTAMNEQSSRSHAIFTVTIVATKKDQKKSTTTSKFHMVDLAGSERCTKTQATGDRFKEGININKGLLALGNVISALGTNQGSGYVRYRDSKLTRLLQDSLGGNSITLMIACVSPADYNVSETLGTLRYANRARQIKNKPIVNQDPHAAEINNLKDIIQKLRVELLSRGGGMTMSLTSAVNDAGLIESVPASTWTADQRQLNQQIKEMQIKNRSLQLQLQQTLQDLAENEMRAHISEAAHENLRKRNSELKIIVNRLTNELTTAAATNANENANSEPNEERERLQKQVLELSQVVDNIEQEHERTELEIQAHKKEFLHNTITKSKTNNAGDESTDSEVHIDEVHEILQPHADEHTKKQIDFNDQLRLINRQLDLKEELHQRVCNNFSKMYAEESEIAEEKVKEFEQKIQELEGEKTELTDKLRHVKENASAKLAEERRKRLQVLEHEIADMKRKIMQQGKMLKVREKESLKIKNLSTEIQQMKESKVKLIRTMRQESEAFRQWKMVREKELMQLKNKDRKLQNEMARKEALHSKQRSVLKRKCEEALAANKRLKETLDRQRVAQALRQKSSTNTTKSEPTHVWVDRELELLISLIDAEHSLEQLMEDRSVITMRLKGIMQQLESTTDCDENAADNLKKECATQENTLELLNAQISDLQQKVSTIDLDTRMAALSDGVQNITELRTIIKQMLKALTQMRREQAQHRLEQKLLQEEQRMQLMDAMERCESVEKRMRLAEEQHQEYLAEKEQAYEEKIAVLLRAPHERANDGATSDGGQQNERQAILEEQLEKLQNELDVYRELEGQRKKRENVAKKLYVKSNDESMDTRSHESMQLSSDEDDEFNASSDSDPDWVRTPLFKRTNRERRRGSSKNNNNNSNNNTKTTANDTYITATSTTTTHDNDNTIAANYSDSSNNVTGSLNATTESAAPGEHKRKPKGCKCRLGCDSKRCGCNSRDAKCTERCACKMLCKNVSRVSRHGDGDDNNENDNDPNEMDTKENTSPIDQSPPNVTTNETISKSMEQAETTTNLERLSVLNFDTPSTKRKFFK